MKNLCELSEKLADAFGIESMIEYVCSLSNEQVTRIAKS